MLRHDRGSAVTGYLTVTEVASSLGLKPRRARILVSTHPQAIRASRVWLLPAEALEGFRSRRRPGNPRSSGAEGANGVEPPVADGANTLTVDAIRLRVDEIAAMSRDAESAHAAEDRLWADVLEAVADGAADGANLAREALTTRDLMFARWCS